MRVREQKMPNRQVRNFNCDQIISPNGWIWGPIKGAHTSETKRLMSRLEAINLVKEVGLHKYQVTIEIQDGFSNSEEDWTRISGDVLKVLADHFGLLLGDIEHEHVAWHE